MSKDPSLVGTTVANTTVDSGQKMSLICITAEMSTVVDVHVQYMVKLNTKNG